MATLPEWFWTLYIIFLSLSFITGLIGLIRQWFSNLSAIAVSLSLLAPLASFIYAVQRPNNLTEYEYLLSKLKAGDLWAIFIAVLFLYLIAWSLFLLTYFIVKVVRKPNVRGKLSITLDRLMNLIKKIPIFKSDGDSKSENIKRESK